MGTSTITVSGLAATPGASQVALSWAVSDPFSGSLLNISLDAVEIHAAATNDRSLASRVTEGVTSAIHTGLARAATRYYWARARDKIGSYGAWYPSSPTGGVSGTELIGGLTVPAVASLAASGGVGMNSLSWTLTDPNGNGLGDLALDVVEIYAAATNNVNAAAKVAEGKTFTIHNGLSRGDTRYYWARPRHVNGTFGAYYPSSPPSPDTGVSATELSGVVSLSVPGYWKLPSGLIIQWGNSGASNASGFAFATFPIAFPNNLFYVAGQVSNNNAFYTPVANLYTDDLTSATWLLTTVDRVSPFGPANIIEEIIVGSTVNYVALGY